MPEKEISNEDFAKVLDTSDEWIKSRTGIERRRVLNLGESAADLAVKAAEEAIKDAGISAADLDFIISSSCSYEYFYPGISCVVQRSVGAINAAAVDINLACSGFLAALDIANAYIDSGKYKTILVVAAESLTKQTDYSDRASCVLFGDGAGAVVVVKPDKPKLYSSFFGAKGELPSNSSLYCRTGLISNSPFVDSESVVDSKMRMDGKAVYKFAVEAIPFCVNKAAEIARISLSDIRIVVPHQANLRIIETAAKALNLPLDMFYVNIHNYGNISSACVPVAISELRAANFLRDGDFICLVGFGAGLAFGSIILEF